MIEWIKQFNMFFLHVTHMSGDWLTKRVLESDLEIKRDKYRRYARWLDQDEKALKAKLLNPRDAELM